MNAVTWFVVLLVWTLQAPTPLVSTVCELESSPQRYAGKMVQVRATVVGRKKLTIFDFATAGCVGQLPVVFPDAIRPMPDFNLEKDETFQKLQKALRERTEIEATFEGRFDYPVQDRMTRRNASGMRMPMRLVLRKVSNLDVTTTRSVDR